MGGLHKVGGARAPLPTMVKNPSPVSGSLLIHYLNLFNCNVSSWKKDQHFPSALPHIFVILPLTPRREMLQIFLCWCLTNTRPILHLNNPVNCFALQKRREKQNFIQSTFKTNITRTSCEKTCVTTGMLYWLPTTSIIKCWRNEIGKSRPQRLIMNILILKTDRKKIAVSFPIQDKKIHTR